LPRGVPGNDNFHLVTTRDESKRRVMKIDDWPLYWKGHYVSGESTMSEWNPGPYLLVILGWVSLSNKRESYWKFRVTLAM
jgi:hypothetical protein